MRVTKTDLSTTGFFSDLFIDYISGKEELKEFYGAFPSETNFTAHAGNCKFNSSSRNSLHSALVRQYEGLELSQEVKDNLRLLLEDNTYTITTGHQLNIFTGPLYFIYKIITVVNAAKRLNEKNKELRFVPVYWMATEDHDFEEINHFFLFNKKITWESFQKGPVGRFSTDGMEKIFAEIKDALPVFQKAYLEQPNLAAATRYMVNALFGEHGLLIIDGDDKALKKEFIPVIKDELANHISSGLISSRSGALEQLGYKLQINPREINLFYIENGLRERIVREGDIYKVLNTEIQFSAAAIFELVEKHPEKFSPNVALRPVFQQAVLPNIAYCGGPAEVAYWLQLKPLLDHYKVCFPILMPRNFALYINSGNYKKIEKSDLHAEDLFLEEHKIKDKIIAKFSKDDHKLEDELQAMENIFNAIKTKAVAVDASLDGFVLAEKQKVLKVTEGIEKRLKKAEENKNEVVINQVLNIRSKLFPEGQLQERRDNFLNFYINDPSFINKIMPLMDPFDYSFNIIIEDE